MEDDEGLSKIGGGGQLRWARFVGWSNLGQKACGSPGWLVSALALQII